MRRYRVEIKGKEYVIDVKEMSENQFYVLFKDQALEVKISSHEGLSESLITPAVPGAGVADEAVVERPATTYHPPAIDKLKPPASTPPPSLPVKPDIPGDTLRSDLTAPMPGVIQAVEVSEGQEVKEGQTVVILEAMKMKNIIRSPRDGVVSEVAVRPGQAVGYGDLLLKFKEG